MRISFFLPRCTPENSHGRYVIELAKRLRGDNQVSVYAGAFWPPFRSMVQCHFLPVPNRPSIARLAALWAASVVAVRRRRADIIHTQGADAPFGNVVTAQFCNAVMQGAPGYGTGLYRRINYAIGAAAERHCMGKASTRRIIAISRQVKSDIEREYRIEPHKVVIVPHGVDLEGFNPRDRLRWRGPARDRLGLGKDEFVVLFVGGDYRRKGLVPLLAAAMRLRTRVKVLAVGVRPDRELAQYVRQNNLSHLVQFLQTTVDLASLYAAVDCYALPTRYDTFSMATLEAMASGLPVCVSRAAGITERLTDGLDCLLLDDPGDVEAIARHLERLADMELRVALGQQARKTAEQFSWDSVASQTLAVYNQAL